ncbi:MAG TPA: T9SS type A sorting domain-containing protein, partial [Chitinophagales bacterium]|nr:T9SS type A sorting domain-containing protein [Chitinophagales bacterium]
FYIIPDWGHTSYSTDLFGTVVQPYFDSTVWYMKNFFAYQLGCPNITTGIKNTTAIKTLNTFPNPSANDVYFEGVQQYIGQRISVSDISGKQVYVAVFDGKPISTKSIGLTNGIYIINITNENTKETTVGKIVVE